MKYFLEKDINGDLLWTWTYPSIEKELKELLMKKCPLACGIDGTPFVYGQFNKSWYHFITVQISENTKLPMVCIPCTTLIFIFPVILFPN